jgi:hypothetical protein
MALIAIDPYSAGGNSMRQNPNTTGRRLTHDELKAAEDAFQGRPFNEASSQAARTVYFGILVAKMKLNRERVMRGLPAPNRDSQRAEEPLEVGIPIGEFAGFYHL